MNDWQGFINQIFRRVPADLKAEADTLEAVLDRALREAHAVAVQATFDTQLLRSGVLCVASYLPDSWQDGTRHRVAIALLDKAGCRAYQGRYKRVEETDWCLTANLPLEGIDLRDPNNRYRPKQELPQRISDYITRLERNKYLVEGEECAVFARVAAGDYRAYTTFAAKTRNINFQSLPGQQRAQVSALVSMWPGKPPSPIAMEDIDISASQLKVALALRGAFYPIELDVWTDLASAIDHNARASASESEWREVVKKIALAVVLGSNTISIPGVWKAATEKTPKKGLTRGLKASIQSALWAAFPELRREIPFTKTTPDGVSIHGIKSERKFWVRGAIQGPEGQIHQIDTSYGLMTYTDAPDTWNVLIAHEAWLIRETILQMFPYLPILPVHDQLYFHEGFKEKVSTTLNGLLSSLSKGELRGTS